MPSPIRPVLRVRRFSAVAVLARSYGVAGGFAADPARFAAPNPPLPELQNQIAKVEAAYKLSLTRAKGTAAACRVECDILYGMLDSERGYVRMLCDASPSEAATIIPAAGMEISASGFQELPILKVSRGAASGTVDLRAGVSILLGGRKSKARFFDWQWTTDGGQTFSSAPTTVNGQTTIAGLAPLALVGFRVKANTTEGPGPWSPIVSILMH